MCCSVWCIRVRAKCGDRQRGQWGWPVQKPTSKAQSQPPFQEGTWQEQRGVYGQRDICLVRSTTLLNFVLFVRFFVIQRSAEAVISSHDLSPHKMWVNTTQAEEKVSSQNVFVKINCKEQIQFSCLWTKMIAA